MPPSSVTGLERAMARRILQTRGDPRLRLQLWNGEELRVSDQTPIGRIVFRDRRLMFYLALHPELGLAQAYADGRLEIEGDLPTVLKAVLAVPTKFTLAKRLRDRWELLRRRSKSLQRSRRNIHHHYDLGNDFYALWLDRRMAYTCAYFPTPVASLEEAQLAKMEHVSRKLWLQP